MKVEKNLLTILLAISSCTYSGRMPNDNAHDIPTDRYASKKEEWQASDRLIKPGAFAPLINLPSLFGSKKVDCNPSKQHIVLFWASWCSDCKEEMPNILNFQQKHPEIPWITISLDNEATKAREYIYQRKLEGTHLFDGRDWRGDACTDYAVGLHGIPYIILIDSIGKIKATCGNVSDLEKGL